MSAAIDPVAGDDLGLASASKLIEHLQRENRALVELARQAYPLVESSTSATMPWLVRCGWLALYARLRIGS